MTAADAPAPGAGTVLVAADNGATATVAVGTPVTIRLAENPTTGFRWELGAIPPAAATVVDRAGASGPGAGAGRQHDWIVTPLRAGRIEVRLVLRRSWEPPDQAGDSFSATVVAE